MQKRSKLIITKFSIFVPLVLFLLLAIYLSGLFLSGNKQRSLDRMSEDSASMLQELNSAWKEGDLSKLSKVQVGECNTLVNYKNQVNAEFFQCNPVFLSCFLKDYQFNGYTPLRFKDRFFEYDKDGNIVISFQKQKSTFRVKLLNTCRDVYLPQKKYSAGTRKNQDYIWDNMSEHIYIDKYYITNLDVLEWKKRLNIKITENEKKLVPYKPNTNLSIEDKHKYCYSINKKVLESHYFDAASYIPNKEDNPKLVKKFPYHWTKKRTLETLDCFNVYSKGCESKRSFKYFEGLSTSWIGTHYTLGAFMEYLPNKFESNKNLKVSSFYYDEKSKWHEIGVRGELGRDNRTRTQQDIGVAFRCMSVR